MDLDRLCRQLEDVLQQPPHSIQPDTAFAAIPNFDSAAQIEVILLLDEHYGVQIPDATLPRLEHVRDLATLVAASQPAGERPG